jgi:hypothetical protein
VKKFIYLLAILAGVFMASNAFAGEILGYPVTPTQVRFYLLILGLIGFSAGMVSVAYLAFWVIDLKKKREGVREIQSCKEKSFARELAVAAQSAK